MIVHGMFSIHGTDREITVPAEVEMHADRWTAMFTSPLPYAKWGMKNPSTLFLRVNDSVVIDLAAAGSCYAKHGNLHSVTFAAEQCLCLRCIRKFGRLRDS